MKKQSSLSTNHTAPRRNSEDPNENEKRSNDREETVAVSPIRWGFLTAGVAHLANVYGSGMTSAHPWVCLHGSVNLVLAGVLGYITLCWNRRFNTDTYVRRELMRFSLANGVAMIGLMAGQTALVIAFNIGSTDDACGGEEDENLLTGYGCMRRMFVGTPIFYAVLGLLWFGFSYIQYVAVANLESSRRGRLPHTTTIDQEVENSMATGNHHRDILSNCHSNPPGTLYYSLSIFSSLALWAMGLAHLGIQTTLSVAAVLSATMILGGIVSLGTRSSWIALAIQAALIVVAAGGLAMSFMDDGLTSTGVRITAAVFTILLQLLGLVGAYLRFRRERESDRSRHEHGREHFFRSNPRAPVAEQDPMAVFAAATKEGAGSADPPSMV